MLVLVAAAMPFRLPISFPPSAPIIGSVSVLDVLLMVALVTLVRDLLCRRLNLGYHRLAFLLAVPSVISALSLLWSQDRAETLRNTLIYVEALVAYLFVTREAEGLSAARVVAFLRRYVWLVVVPSVFLLLHVPGFAPYEPGLSHTSGDYLSYYSRLSHPILGRSNNLAAVLVLLAPVLLYFGYTRRDRRTMLAGMVAAAAIACTFSRGVMASVVIAGTGYLLLLLLLRRLPRVSRRPLAGSVIAVTLSLFAAPAALYALNPPTREFFRSRLSADNIARRVELQTAASEKIESRPFQGYGAGAVPDGDSVLTVDVHNTYLQQVLNFGLPLGVLVGLAIASLPLFFLLRRHLHPIAGAIGFAVLVEIVSFAFESSFEGTVLRVIFYLLIGLLAGFLRSAVDDARRAEPRSTAEATS